MVKVRDRVMVNVTGGAIVATVFHVDKVAAYVIADTGACYKPPLSRPLQPASSKAPPELADRIEELVASYGRVWKKTDRASIKDDGKILHGTISKGGAKPTMVLDGGQTQITAPSHQFLPGKPLELDPPCEMDRWSISRYRVDERLSDETNAYSADILLDGKIVIQASNHGQGGSDSYHPVKGHTYEVVERFENAARAWFSENDVDYGSEAAAGWVEFVTAKRPYGISTETYMNETRQMFADIAPAPPAPSAPRP